MLFEVIGEASHLIAVHGRAKPRDLLEFGFSFAPMSLTVSAVCVRRNEMKRAENGESGQRCGETVPISWCVGSGSVLAPVHDKAQVAAR